MEKIKNTAIPIIMMLLALQFSIAQNYSADESTEQDKTIQQLQMIDLFTIQNNQARLNNLTSKSIKLQQIGDLNTASARVRANASDIKITQNGNENNVALDYNVNKVITSLEQNGSNNNITDYVNSTNAEITLDLTQQGDNLNFIREGINDLTKSIRFRQTEASPEIIIRSSE